MLFFVFSCPSVLSLPFVFPPTRDHRCLISEALVYFYLSSFSSSHNFVVAFLGLDYTPLWTWTHTRAVIALYLELVYCDINSTMHMMISVSVLTSILHRNPVRIRLQKKSNFLLSPVLCHITYVVLLIIGIQHSGCILRPFSLGPGTSCTSGPAQTREGVGPPGDEGKEPALERGWGVPNHLLPQLQQHTLL